MELNISLPAMHLDFAALHLGVGLRPMEGAKSHLLMRKRNASGISPPSAWLMAITR